MTESGGWQLKKNVLSIQETQRTCINLRSIGDITAKSSFQVAVARLEGPSVGGQAGRALPNVLSINYKLNYWRMWDGNIGKWINFNTYRAGGRFVSFRPLLPQWRLPPGKWFLIPAATGNGSVYRRLERCYILLQTPPMLPFYFWRFNAPLSAIHCSPSSWHGHNDVQ